MVDRDTGRVWKEKGAELKIHAFSGPDAKWRYAIGSRLVFYRYATPALITLIFLVAYLSGRSVRDSIGYPGPYLLASLGFAIIGFALCTYKFRKAVKRETSDYKNLASLPARQISPWYFSPTAVSFKEGYEFYLPVVAIVLLQNWWSHPGYYASFANLFGSLLELTLFLWSVDCCYHNYRLIIAGNDSVLVRAESATLVATNEAARNMLVLVKVKSFGLVGVTLEAEEEVPPRQEQPNALPPVPQTVSRRQA